MIQKRSFLGCFVAYEHWARILREEHRLDMFGSRALTEHLEKEEERGYEGVRKFQNATL
jgi:hypothetical protein